MLSNDKECKVINKINRLQASDLYNNYILSNSTQKKEKENLNSQRVLRNVPRFNHTFFAHKIKDGCEEVAIKPDKPLRFTGSNHRSVVGKRKFIPLKS